MSLKFDFGVMELASYALTRYSRSGGLILPLLTTSSNIWVGLLARLRSIQGWWVEFNVKRLQWRLMIGLETQSQRRTSEFVLA